MTDESQSDETVDSETAITLGVLSAVERGEPLTQRSLASELGIALGLANSYLKRCVRKGFVKVSQAPPNRYAYYLTPKGFSEKARLTGDYLSSSLGFYRRARAQCAECLEDCAQRGFGRVALYGLSELAEIAAMCQLESRVEIVGIVDPRSPPRRFAGLQVVPDAAGLPKYDAMLVTEVRNAQTVYDRLAARYGRERVLAPRLLNVNRSGMRPMPDDAAEAGR